MNERIKQLAEQAGWDYSKVERRNQTEHFDEAKFAKLIVRECAGRVDWILAEGGKTQGDLIKQHFGVEE
jgi:predicted fused transcriptional regulator/phosphomethylpyrimidine kinase